MGNRPSDVLATAAAEIGYREGRDASGRWNNNQKYSLAVPGMAWSNNQPWCATFVSWVMWRNGVQGVTYSASVATLRDYFRRAGRWTEYPTRGAVVIYGTTGSAHTGIVESWTADTVTCIEGNTNTSGSAEGDGVYRRTRQRRDPYVYGYGIPRYEVPIESADPAWHGRLLGDVPVKPVPQPSTPTPASPVTPAPPDDPALRVVELEQPVPASETKFLLTNPGSGGRIFQTLSGWVPDGKTRTIIGSSRLTASGAGRARVVRMAHNGAVLDGGLPLAEARIESAGTTTLSWLTEIGPGESVQVAVTADLAGPVVVTRIINRLLTTER